jgi:lipopolysaccharide biosynthesis glycosyltransferase
VAESVKSREPKSANRYDVIIFASPSEVTDTHLAWMGERGILHRGDMDMAPLTGLKQFSGRLTEATLMKLSLASHLAGEYDRVLYLDCDLSIHDDVGRIFSLDTGASPLAAAPSGRILVEISEERQKETLAHFKALGMTEPYRFFNSGVLYIDVKKWNDARLGERALAYIKANPALCFLPDEHALNAILDGDIAELAPIWNSVPLGRRDRETHDIARPVIVHHAGEDKPWKRYGYRKRLFPDRTAYRQYEAFIRDTPWPTWLDEQWTAKDLRANIAWEWRRLTRKLRGTLDEPTAAIKKLHLDLFRRYCAEHRFADVEQGLVERPAGRLRLKPRPASEAAR